MKKSANSFPYDIGINIGKEEGNQFSGRIDESVKKELDLTLSLQWIGQQALRFSAVCKKEKPSDKEFLSLTDIEKDYNNSKSFKQVLDIKPNLLRFTTTSKVVINYLIVLFGVIAEWFIYTSIAENAFAMPLFKAYFLGLLVVVFTKYVSLTISPNFKKWIREKEVLKRSLIKTTSFVLVILILINAGMLGITNLYQIEKINKITQLEYVSTSIMEGEENGEDVTALKLEADQLNNAISESETTNITSGIFCVE